MDSAVLYTKLLEAGLPVIGLSVGDPNDRLTWRIGWEVPPTVQQEADAQGIVDGYDIAVEDGKNNNDNGIKRADVICQALKALSIDKAVATETEITNAIQAAWLAKERGEY